MGKTVAKRRGKKQKITFFRKNALKNAEKCGKMRFFPKFEKMRKKCGKMRKNAEHIFSPPCVVCKLALQAEIFCRG